MPDFFFAAGAAHKGIPAAPKGTAYANADRLLETPPQTIGGGAPYTLIPFEAFGERLIPGTWIVADNGVTAVVVDANTWQTNVGTLSPQTAPALDVTPNGFPFAFIQDGTPLDAALLGATSIQLFARVSPIAEIDADSYTPETFGMWAQSVAALTPDVVAATIEAYDRRIRANGGQFVTPSGVVVTGASAGLVGIDRRVFVAPTDIGGGADQLPPDAANLTARALENHPTVFYGRSDSQRAAGLLGAHAGVVSEPRPLLTPIPPPGSGVQVNALPLVVTGVPTFALWTVVLDGCLYRGFFAVPGGNPAGLVRPRDLFQATFNQARATGTAPTWIYQIDPVAGPVRSILIRGWERLSYARCELLFDENGPLPIAPVYTPEEAAPN